jgi:ubiquinone/menaquinone biosynthesis C-methylase UbiE
MATLSLRLYWGIEQVIAPGLRYSQQIYEDALCALVNSGTVWLDIGCGHHVLPKWRLDAERQLVKRASYVAGIDMDITSLAQHQTITNTWVGSAEMLPFPDESFNLITANMVVEHLADPSLAFAEICRVLVPGGLFVFHTPNVNGYVAWVSKRLPNKLKKVVIALLENRTSADVYPTYYRCNADRTIVEIADLNGLEVSQIRHIPTTAVFARVLPMAAVELLWIRATMLDSLVRYRSNILCVLRKTCLVGKSNREGGPVI